MRTRALAGSLAAAVLLAGAAPAAAQDDGPPTVRAKSGKRVVKAELVSFCWMSSSRGMCADGVYRHTATALEWRARAPLVFGTSAPVDSLRPCLMQIDGSGAVRSLGVCLTVARGSDGKWRGRMPKNLRGANSLSVAVTSGTNDAFYAVSVTR